jgi:hypothetical protein
MLWPDGTPDERKVEYLRLLVRLTGHRKSRDRAVCIMAVHGCPVERLRTAISLGDPDPTFDAILDSGDEVAIDEAVKDIVDTYMDSPLGDGIFNRPTTDALTSLSVARAKSASKSHGQDETDLENIKIRGIKVKPDAPETVRRQVGRQLIQASLTGEMYDTEVVEAFTDLDESQVDVLARALPPLAAEVNHLAETMPLDEIAAICRVIRTITTPDQLGPKSDRLSDDDLDEIAARNALGMYVFNRNQLRSFAEQYGLDLTAADASLRCTYGLPISAEDESAAGQMARELTMQEDDELPT